MKKSEKQENLQRMKDQLLTMKEGMAKRNLEKLIKILEARKN